MSDRVVFHGQVAEDHKHALLERATIHLAFAQGRLGSIAVTEAAQHGVPTIGYRSSGGLRDSVVDGETGLLVDSKAELISATKPLLIDASSASKLGASAKQRAENYKWRPRERSSRNYFLVLRRRSSPSGNAIHSTVRPTPR
ncbi:glycosyltransferase [Streptomyces sp. NA13]|uniref:glycosyltransferase n=1 Tax=Streptomyces sp. NA13 TaxID=2996051 RepID=UPI003B63A880